MNNKYTLKELVKVYEKTYYQTGRDAGIKAVLDFIGYEFPKNEEREAFDAWWQTSNSQTFCDAEEAFKAWKAGREELLKTQALAKEPNTKTEPAWIPWSGGDKSPIVGEQRYEVKYRDGVMHTYTQNNVLCWRHSGMCADIIAYRILKP